MAKVFSSLISAAFCNPQWLGQKKSRARKLDVKNSRMKMVSIQDPKPKSTSQLLAGRILVDVQNINVRIYIYIDYIILLYIYIPSGCWLQSHPLD